MSKLTDQYKLIGIHNGALFAGKGTPRISYIPADNGRGGHSARWMVYRLGYLTDPKGHWQDHGNKAFTVPGVAWREEKLRDAQEWCRIRYRVREWAKTPFGDWMDAGFVERRMKELATLIQKGQNDDKQTGN
jgi:hypothetical protein